MEKKYVRVGDKVFFNKNIFMNKVFFVNMFHVKYNSYFYMLYSRLYDYLIGNSTNLHKEYKKYYKQEFSSMREFILERYNLCDEDIEAFAHKNSYYKLRNNGMDNPVHGLLYIDTINVLISEFFGGDFNEN